MADLEAVAPNYRRAKDRWEDAPGLLQCHEALITCFNSNAFGLVEHVKSFIETVCITIVAEFNGSLPSANPSTTDLLVAALRPLGLGNSRGASKLDKVLSGFNRLTDALTEMRNENGPIAHGKDAFLDALTLDHSRAFLYAGDSILGLLLNALEGKEPDLKMTREPYERFQHLNERIDQAVGLEARIEDDDERPVVVIAVATGSSDEAIEIRIEPSRLLYGMDRGAYVEVLKTITLLPDAGPTKLEESGLDTMTVGSAVPVTKPDTRLSTELVPAYSGKLAVLHSEFESFVGASMAGKLLAGPQGASLTDSLLATADENMGLDWKQREVLQARLRIALKRVLLNFGIDAASANLLADRAVDWLQIHAPESEPSDQAAG